MRLGITILEAMRVTMNELVYTERRNMYSK